MTETMVEFQERRRRELAAVDPARFVAEMNEGIALRRLRRDGLALARQRLVERKEATGKVPYAGKDD